MSVCNGSYKLQSHAAALEKPTPIFAPQRSTASRSFHTKHTQNKQILTSTRPRKTYHETAGTQKTTQVIAQPRQALRNSSHNFSYAVNGPNLPITG